MASAKPSIVAELEAGKLIDTIPGVVSTWNWFRSCFTEILCGRGLSLSGLAEGKPKLDLALSGKDGVVVANAGKNGKVISIDWDKLPDAVVDRIATAIASKITITGSNGIEVTGTGGNFNIDVHYI